MCDMDDVIYDLIVDIMYKDMIEEEILKNIRKDDINGNFK